MPESKDTILPKMATNHSKKPPVKRHRKSSEDRARDIIEAAADYFSEVGFGGSTRDIAKRVGVTQPLLYRYFPDKDSLIEAVYRKEYLESWNPDWDEGLSDRSLSVRDRFEAFYRCYAAANFNPRWLRISHFAGLRDTRINQWYNHLVEELILRQLVREHRVELGGADVPFVSVPELEPAWQMHGGLLHYAWRRHVLELPAPEDVHQVIHDALNMYFAIAPQIYEREASRVVDNGQQGN